MSPELTLIPGAMTLEQLTAIHAAPQRLVLDPAARPAIRASAAVVQAAAAGDAPVYCVNTGFGKLASTRISAADLALLQLNLIRSHSVGVGEPLSAPVVRLMLAMKAASLARAHSGVRELVIDTLLAVHNAGLVPWVPAQGSVGASGDLAPLSHMTLALQGVLAFEPVLESALVIGALTVVAARGSDGPFDPRIHALRGQPGQIDVAQRRSWYWPQAHNDVVQKLLRKARKGCRVVFIPGNHDEFARKYLGHNFGGIEVVKEWVHETADGRKL